MFKPIAVLAVLLTAVLSFGSTISGHMTWVTGTLNANVQAKSTAQTISLKVGATNQSITGVFVVGNTASSIYPSGTPFEVLLAGSQPFAATYTTTSLIAGTLGFGPSDARTVPMSTAGVTSNGIGFPAGPGTEISLLTPPFTIGTLSFRNGIEVTLGAPIAAYSLTIPTSSTTTIGTVTFPTGSIPIESFQLNAVGNGVLSFIGNAASKSVVVAGNITGVATIFTSAQLRINTGFVF